MGTFFNCNNFVPVKKQYSGPYTETYSIYMEDSHSNLTRKTAGILFRDQLADVTGGLFKSLETVLVV